MKVLFFVAALILVLPTLAGKPMPIFDGPDIGALHEGVYRKLCHAMECATTRDGLMGNWDNGLFEFFDKDHALTVTDKDLLRKIRTDNNLDVAILQSIALFLDVFIAAPDARSAHEICTLWTEKARRPDDVENTATLNTIITLLRCANTLSAPETATATNWKFVSSQLYSLAPTTSPLALMFSDYLLLLMTLQERTDTYTVTSILEEDTDYSRQDIYGPAQEAVWVDIFDDIRSGHTITSGLEEAFRQYFDIPDAIHE